MCLYFLLLDVYCKIDGSSQNVLIVRVVVKFLTSIPWYYIIWSIKSTLFWAGYIYRIYHRKCLGIQRRNSCYLPAVSYYYKALHLECCSTRSASTVVVVIIVGRHIYHQLTICYYHVTYVFQSKSTYYSCVNVKGFLAQNRCDIWSLSDNKRISNPQPLSL